jgi:deoxyadenosine/deoxycytidine kinase
MVKVKAHVHMYKKTACQDYLKFMSNYYSQLYKSVTISNHIYIKHKHIYKHKAIETHKQIFTQIQKLLKMPLI